MRKSIVQLGSTPRMRRSIAALLLIGTAIVTAFLRDAETQRLTDFAMNIAVAIIALVVLHFRWRAGEKKRISPAKARDIFS